MNRTSTSSMPPVMGLLIGLLCLAVLTACSNGFRASSEFETGTDFTSYRSFGWMSEELTIHPAGDTAPPVNPLSQKKFRAIIERVLEARGFDKKEDGAPDFLVTFGVNFRDRVYSTVWGFGRAYVPGYGFHYPYSLAPYSSPVVVDTYIEATVTIDLFDGASGEPVWHGSARRRVSNDRWPEDRIDAAVSAILDRFPPGRAS